MRWQNGVLVVAALVLPLAIAQAEERDSKKMRFTFAGYEWMVKRSDKPTAPQGNRFGGLGMNVVLSAEGALVLRLQSGADGLWRAAEVVLSRSLGYGTYRFRLASRLDRYDDAVVVGLFTWDTDAAYAHREMDIEFSTWGGQIHGANAQYVVQPHENGRSLWRFVVRQEGDYTSHELRWMKDSADFASWHGHGPRPEQGSPLLIQEWSYTGDGVPPVGKERIRINLYLFEGKPPRDGRNVELVVNDFQFEPYEDRTR